MATTFRPSLRTLALQVGWRGRTTPNTSELSKRGDSILDLSLLKWHSTYRYSSTSREACLVMLHKLVQGDKFGLTKALTCLSVRVVTQEDHQQQSLKR